MRFKVIFVRVIKELLRDKRILVLMLVVFVLVLILMYFIFDINNDVNLEVGVDESVFNKIVNVLFLDKVKIKEYDLLSLIKKMIVNLDLDVYIEKKGDKFDVIYKNENLLNIGIIK